MEFGPIVEGLPLIVQGIWTTLIAAFFGSLIAVSLGFVLGLATLFKNPIVVFPLRTYIYFFRGTPPLVILFLVFFGFPMLGMTFPALQAGIVALGLQNAAYVAEVVRGGLQSVGKEQHEAAALDGASRVTVLWRIILPQSLRQMIPGVVNQIIGLVKSTSLLAVISVGEATRALQLISSQAFVPFEAYLTLACIYLVLIAIISRSSIMFEKWVERRIF